jgi:transposase
MAGLSTSVVSRNFKVVEPYLGLMPRARQSGEIDRTGRITKTGDGMARSYLLEAANGLLTRIQRPSPLRRCAYGVYG